MQRSNTTIYLLVFGAILVALSCGCRRRDNYYDISAYEEPQRQEIQKKGVDLFQAPRTSERVTEAVSRFLETVSPADNYQSLNLATYACSWLADYGPNRDRAKWAEKGMRLGKEGIVLSPSSVEANYYYLLNMGFYSRHHRFGAIRRVSQMEDLALRVVEMDPKLDDAGGHRFLGNLYAKAPPFPASIGDMEEAFFHMKKAVEIAPDYPENRLHLGKVYLKARDYEEAIREFELCLKMQWDEPEISAWHQEAQALIEKARTRQSNNGNGHNRLYEYRR